MGRRELEEIFEECLSALLEGRRSIEESLSLYPSLADELEPLLRAAAEIAPAFHYDPPAGYLEEARRRFLAAAAARRGRAVASAQQASGPWWRWVPLAASVVAGLGGLAIVGATLMDEGGGGGFSGEEVTIRVMTPTPAPAAASLGAPLEQAQEQLAVLESAVEQGQPLQSAVIREVIRELKEASKQIAARLDDPAGLEHNQREALLTLASKQYCLLLQVRDQVSGAQVGDVNETLAVAEEVLEKLGASPVPQASPTPQVSPVPQASPTPQVSPEAQPSPAPSPTTGSPSAQESPTPSTPTLSPQPCPAASPTPVSSPTPPQSPTAEATPSPPQP